MSLVLQTLPTTATNGTLPEMRDACHMVTPDCTQFVAINVLSVNSALFEHSPVPCGAHYAATPHEITHG